VLGWKQSGHEQRMDAWLFGGGTAGLMVGANGTISVTTATTTTTSLAAAGAANATKSLLLSLTLVLQSFDLTLQPFDQPQVRSDQQLPLRVERGQQIGQPGLAFPAKQALGTVDQPHGQRAVDPIPQRRALLHERRPAAGQFPHPLRGFVGMPDLRQKIAAQQLGQHVRVDLVGFDFELRDGFGGQRIGHHHSGHVVVASRATWSVGRSTCSAKYASLARVRRKERVVSFFPSASTKQAVICRLCTSSPTKRVAEFSVMVQFPEARSAGGSHTGALAARRDLELVNLAAEEVAVTHSCHVQRGVAESAWGAKRRARRRRVASPRYSLARRTVSARIAKHSCQGGLRM
jgi:hypothetical protein